MKLPDDLLPQTRAYVATEHDPSPIRSQARERCCLTGVDKTVRPNVVPICPSPQ